MSRFPLYDDIFNDLSADLDENLALSHLLLSQKGVFVILGSREAFEEELKKCREEVVRDYQQGHRELTPRN